jgi:hypothetical protein
VSKTSKTPERASKQPSHRIAVLVWRGSEDVTRMGFTDPLEALLTAITYLRRKYHVRLTDAACDALEELAPELERLLPSEGGKPGAAARELAKRARKVAASSQHPGGFAAIPVATRLAVPAAVFASPGAVPVALD